LPYNFIDELFQEVCLNIDDLKNVDEAIRDIGIKGGVLTNIALHLRSCECELLTLHFEGLILDTLKNRGEEVVKIIDSTGFPWDLVYLNPFPGMELIKRVTFRKLCSHCLKNYKIERSIGMGTMIFREKKTEGG